MNKISFIPTSTTTTAINQLQNAFNFPTQTPYFFSPPTENLIFSLDHHAQAYWSSVLFGQKQMASPETRIDEEGHENIVKRITYPLCTPDNIRVRMLLSKELKNSDVTQYGRIIIPKKKAEENFPKLHDKQGMLLFVRDVYSVREWTFKYKYWDNNKNKMYVLENTGEFVKQNGLMSGDTLNFYKDEINKIYVSAKKVARERTTQILQDSSNPIQTFLPRNYDHQQQVEEYDVMMMLIQQLNYQEQEQAHKSATLLPIFNMGSSSSLFHETRQNESSSKCIAGKTTITMDNVVGVRDDGQEIKFDDWFVKAGELPAADDKNDSLDF